MYVKFIKDFFKNDLRYGFYGRIYIFFFKKICVNNYV